MSARELIVLAPGAFSRALDAIAAAYGAKQECQVLLRYGPATGAAPQSLVSRLADDEPADVVLLPTALLGEQIAHGHVALGSDADVMRSLIGACVRAGTRIPDISTVAALTQVLRDAGTVALSPAGSGAYVSNVLYKCLGLEAEMSTKTRTISGEPVGVVVARGEAELGFQQMSELLVCDGISIVGPLPDEVQSPTVIAAGITSRSRRADEAEAFVSFFGSVEAAPLLRSGGVEPIGA
ncbi:MAG: substrate-binding domain-containing protein [Hyphomicrobiaceae bacterium]